MKLNISFWLKFSLLNLCIVALLGTLMRYKIGFEFPYLDQKNIQHSHSHFAFAGWISHTLMTLMVYYLQQNIGSFLGQKYKKIIIANLVCAYGMLVFFIIQGYGLFSISFSTASVLVSYYFAYQFFRDLKQLDSNLLSKNWFQAALLFSVISSLGTFYLAYMMASKNIVQEWYLSSIYYYLHFQYNGWFFFACMGLLFGFLNLKKSEHVFYNRAYILFAAACLPSYFLSTLWLKLSLWIYILAVMSAIVQVYAWFKLLLVLKKTKGITVAHYPAFLRYILLFVGFALTIKLLLQLGSTIPSLSDLAFGFRPIVIAYLHLVLLAVISLFLLFYVYANQLLFLDNKVRLGVILFSIGVFLNEIVLAVQGVASFSYTVIPHVDGLLFTVAVLLLTSIGLTAFFSLRRKCK